MNDNIIFEHTICGIYCDNENCNYQDETVAVKDLPQWINKPCPLCSENLLTEQDFDNHLRVQATVEVINNLSDEEILQLDKIIKNSGFDIKTSDVLKGAKGLIHLYDSQNAVEITVDSHKEIKITEIKLINDEQTNN